LRNASKMENVTVFVRAPKTEVQATLIIKGFAEEMAIKPGEHFVSDEFLVKEVPMWLRVYPNGVNEEGFVSVYLRSRNSRTTFPFKYRFVTDVKTTEMVESHVSASDLSHDRFLSHAECREHYKQRDFVLKVEVEVEGERVKILGKGAATMQRKPIGQEVTEAAFQQKAWTDFTLEFGGEEVACHRIILGGASPVFAAMFENQHREALEGRAVTQLSTTQLSAEVGRAFVRYLYLGEIDEELLEQEVEAFLELGDKYQVDRLKELAEDTMLRMLDKTNAVPFLATGDQFRATRIRAAALRLIKASLMELRGEPAGRQQLEKLDKHILELL